MRLRDYYPEYPENWRDYKPKETTMNSIKYKKTSLFKELGMVPYGAIFRFVDGEELYMKTDGGQTMDAFQILQLKSGRTYTHKHSTKIILLPRDEEVTVLANANI